MLRMSRFLMLVGAAALLMGMTVTAFAQQQQRRRSQFRGPLPAAVYKKIGADDAQLKKIQSARETRQKAIEAARTLEGQERRQAFQKAGQAYNQTVQSILTTEQKSKLEKLMMEARNYRGLGQMSVAILVVDGLTGDQKSKLKSLSDKYAPEWEKLRGQQGSREARRALSMSVGKDVNAVLNAEQQKQLRAATQVRRRRPTNQ